MRDFLVLTRSKPTLWCRVQKESAANTVETCNRVRALLDDRIIPDPRLGELGVTFHFFAWSDIWVYLLANFAGGIAAAWVFLYVNPAEEPTPREAIPEP